MLIPGLDLARLFLWRTMKKSEFFVSDQNHIHHILMNKFSGIKLQIVISLLILTPIIIFNFTQIFFVSFFIGILIYSLLILLCRKN